MVNDINWLAAQGCRVIVDDVSFFDQPFFQDGTIAQTVASLPSNVVYVTAAGNYASTPGYWTDGHYQGMYCAVLHHHLPNLLHHDQFRGPSAIRDIYGNRHRRPAMERPMGASTNTYGLYLFGWSGSTWVQVTPSYYTNGTGNPWREDVYNNTSYSEMAWLISKSSGSARELELYFYGSAGSAGNVGTYTNVIYTQTDSIFGQGAVSSVITCGAVDAASSGYSTVEPFSSQGPSTIYTNFSTQTSTLRQSLDGCGVDDVQTEVGQLGYFENPFYGTSAAAPHVAALAALMLSANPSLTSAQVQSCVYEHGRGPHFLRLWLR